MSASLLVILPHNPGDVVMALTALARIRAAYPAEVLALDFVVGEECRELAEGHPLLRRVFPLPRRALKEAWAAGDADAVLARLESFLSSLNRETYTFSLNLFQERYGALLQGLIAAERKAGLELVDGQTFRVGSRYLEHLFAVPASRRDNGWHAVDLYVRAARELLEPVMGKLVSGPTLAAGVTASNGLGGKAAWPQPPAGSALPPLSPPPGWDGPSPGTYLAFHPGSAWPGKRWPESHWASLAEACARAGVPMVWTGSPEEQEGLSRLRDALSPAARSAVHLWAGRTTLVGAAWIHAGARMAVTGDTVAMHLAAAAGTPTVSLFGPSNPVETGPYGRGHFIWQADADLPADLEFAREHAGLRSMSPEKVSAFVLEGRIPDATPVWETAWDAARDGQALRGHRGQAHPFQARGAPLMDWLDGRRPADTAAAASAGTPSPPDGPAAKVRETLDRCLAAGAALGPEDLRALDQADRNLAAATRDDLVWEAYRIAVNGLPLKDIYQHLRLRRERLDRAVQEESATLHRP